MGIKHKIILKYIKDLSVEIPDAESLLVARERISQYKLNLDIKSKPLKNKMIEVFTKLTYTDKEESKKKAHFEMVYSTVVQIEEENPKKDQMEKFILCDLQIDSYPKIQEAFVQILKQSGFNKIKMTGKIDFLKLYQQKKN